MSRRSPAFQFYPDNFVSGAPAFMRPLETHVYVWLLCLDWTHRGFVLNERDLASWCHVTVAEFRKAWPKVSESFAEREGRYYNPRLDDERDKQEEYSQRMSENGRKGGRPKADEKPQESRSLAVVKPNESIPFPTPSPITTTTPKPPAGATAEPDVDSVITHYLAVHPRRRAGNKERGAVRAALRLGYAATELCAAIDGNAGDEWCKQKKKHELTYTLRNAGLIDGFREKAADLAKPLVDPDTLLPSQRAIDILTGAA